jgi:ubiquinone/menaquinone biosynthesis C-methylase UbiE
MTQSTRTKLVPEMEGAVARWYARNRGSRAQLKAYREQARRLMADRPDGSAVLEVAPGPGYFAIEVARLGHTVTCLDISRTFVEIATSKAAEAGVPVDVRQGDVAAMPFEDGSFDLVVCQAAFKNFTRPVAALDEMYRVLRPGGVAVIQDLCRDVTAADIAAEVRGMEIGPVASAMTRMTLAWLRRRAYSTATFTELAAASTFGTCTVQADGIGLEVRLTRP